MGDPQSEAVSILKKDWPRIKVAWRGVLLLVGLVAVFGFLVALWITNERVDAAHERMNAAFEERDRIKDDLAAAEERAGKAEKALADINSQPVTGADRDLEGQPENGPNAYPAAMVTLHVPMIISHLPIGENEPIYINVGLDNRSPDLARNVRWNGTVRLFNSPNSNYEESQFLDELSNGMLLQIPFDLPPYQEKFKTLAIQLNEDELADVRKDNKRVYVLTKSSWEDKSGAHNSESCVYVLHPDHDPAWPTCNSHNYLH